MKIIICSKKEIAKMFGLTRSQLYECIVDGMPRENHQQFGFFECLKWYFPNSNAKRANLSKEIRYTKTDWLLVNQKLNEWTLLNHFIPGITLSISKDNLTKFPAALKEIEKTIYLVTKELQLKNKVDYEITK